MPTYKYRARDVSGKAVVGLLEAGGTDVAVIRLGEMGYIPVALKETRAKGNGFLRNLFKRKVGAKDLIVFNRQLATLHANNANQSIERVITFFPAGRHEQIYQLLSLNLKAIVSQRLIPTEDGKRVAVMEILLDTSRVKDLIQKKEITLLKEAMKQGVQEGMQTFDQAIYDCYIQGKITYKTAIAYADSANDVRLRIKAEGVGAPVEEDAGKPAFKLRSEVSRT